MRFFLPLTNSQSPPSSGRIDVPSRPLASGAVGASAVAPKCLFLIVVEAKVCYFGRTAAAACVHVVRVPVWSRFTHRSPFTSGKGTQLWCWWTLRGLFTCRATSCSLQSMCSGELKRCLEHRWARARTEWWRVVGIGIDFARYSSPACFAGFGTRALCGFHVTASTAGVCLSVCVALLEPLAHAQCIDFTSYIMAHRITVSIAYQTQFPFSAAS